MTKFILWRLVQFPLILAVIYLVTFVMIWVVPGSPFESERNPDPAKLQTLKEQFKADHWYTFLGYYPWRIITAGDFGPSMHNKEFSVNEIVAGRFPVSVQLGLAALVIAAVGGMTIGTISAIRRDGILDWAGMTLTLVGISVPAFVTAAVLLLVFVARLKWFGLGKADGFPSVGLFLISAAHVLVLAITIVTPRTRVLALMTAILTAGWWVSFFHSAGAEWNICAALLVTEIVLLVAFNASSKDLDAATRTLAAVFLLGHVISMMGLYMYRDVVEGYRNMLLPAVALSLAPMAYIVRLQRVSMLDVLGADYVRTARAKGLSKSVVIAKHCMRNAFLPVFTYLGPAAAVTLTGSFVVERVFAVPGLGAMFVDSVTNRDQTLILALVMVYSALVLGFNLLVDIGYVFIDPRIDVTAGNA